jgi:hypothetical protein
LEEILKNLKSDLSNDYKKAKTIVLKLLFGLKRPHLKPLWGPLNGSENKPRERETIGKRKSGCTSC